MPTDGAAGPVNAHAWTESFRVRAYEVGDGGTLSIASLCNYLQEAAGNHAHALGVSIAQHPGLTWMLRRLIVEVSHAPAWGADAEVTTWPTGHNGLQATREFVVRTGGALCAAATSAWIMIDIARRRPIRLPAFVDAIPLPGLPPPIPESVPRPAVPEAPEHLQPFTVFAGDLDQNRHANNVAFVGWAMHALPAAIHEAFAPTRIDIDFRAEARLGDALLSVAAPAATAETTFDHALYRIDGDERRLLAVARTSWTARTR